MHHAAPSHETAGFALAEALIALLLLAMATAGGGVAMIHSLAGQRSALLRTQAADLAADLAEALRSAPDTAAREGEIQGWQAAVLLRLPQGRSRALPRMTQPGSRSSGFDVQLQWRDGRAPPAMLELPVALALPPDAP